MNLKDNFEEVSQDIYQEENDNLKPVDQFVAGYAAIQQKKWERRQRGNQRIRSFISKQKSRITGNPKMVLAGDEENLELHDEECQDAISDNVAQEYLNEIEYIRDDFNKDV